MLVTRLVCLALVARATADTSNCGDHESIGDYKPCTDVVQHAKIDLDVKDIVTLSGVVDGANVDVAGAKERYTVGKHSGKDEPYADAPFRTLQSFSTKFAAEGKEDMRAEAYHMMFKEYYGDDNWADKWNLAALDSTPTAFTSGRGNADFSTVNDPATLNQAVKKGVVYMNDWQYAIHEMYAAIRKCEWDSSDGNLDAIHAWDEAVAFYAGSQVMDDASDNGDLMFGISVSRGGNFGTMTDGDPAESHANIEVYKDFNKGKEKILSNNCGGLEGQLQRIISYGNVPLVQGVLKYAQSFNSGLKQAAEAGVFLAALQGKINDCSPDVANTLYAELKIGRFGTTEVTEATVRNVKSQLESQYKCLGITCPDVGCYLSSGACAYATCTSSRNNDGIGAPIVGYTPSATISVLPHLLIDHDQAAIEGYLGEATEDGGMRPYMMAHAVYSTVSFSPHRTLKSFSTKFIASETMQEEKVFKQFYDYYGDYDYANKWVEGALLGEYVNMDNRGDADFRNMNQKDTRVQAAKKGTAYMNALMYSIHELESAISKCPDNTGNSVHAWDEGWAFWVGETPGSSAPGNPGVMGYQLGQKRAGDFGTKNDGGVAKANEAMRLTFSTGKAEIEAGNCDKLRPIADTISNHFFIPVIQGVLKYAWYSAQADSATLKGRAEAATFMAAVVPRVYACNEDDGETLYNNLKIGSESTNFDEVKEALESNYECMGITCADIGGLLMTDSTSVYRTGFAAGCTTTADGYMPTGLRTNHEIVGDYPSSLGPQGTGDDDDLSDGAIAGIVIGSVVGAALLIGICVFLVKKHQGASDLPK